MLINLPLFNYVISIEIIWTKEFKEIDDVWTETDFMKQVKCAGI